MKPKEYRRIALKFQKYTGLNLSDYIDWYLSANLHEIVFKMDKYLDYCNQYGMMDDESIEEFNLRFWKHGNRVNAIIKKIIK